MASIFDEDFFDNLMKDTGDILGEDLIQSTEKDSSTSSKETPQKASIPGMIPTVIKGREGREALKRFDDRFEREKQKRLSKEAPQDEEHISPYGNKILDKYYDRLTKQEDKLQNSKKINMSSPMSERYYFDGDIGQRATKENGLPNAKTSGWTGLYTKKQMVDAGEDIGQKDVDIAEVPSTAVENIRYNPKTKNLYIRFVGGSKEYLYPGVPEDTVRKFLNANSKGRYVGNRLKKYAVSAAQAQAIQKANKGE